MKKRIWCIVILSILLSACNSNKYVDDKIKEIITNNSTSYEEKQISMYNGCCNTLMYSVPVDGGCYFAYSMIHVQKKYAENYKLSPYYYYDENTNTTSIMCSKPECEHNDPTICEAFFSDVSNNVNGVDYYYNSEFIVYNNRLWTLGYDSEKGIKVISYDLTGNDRVIETTIETDPQYRIFSSLRGASAKGKSFVIYDDKMFVHMYRRVDSESPYEYYIAEVDLKSKKVSVLLSWSVPYDVIKTDTYRIYSHEMVNFSIDDTLYVERQVWEDGIPYLDILCFNGDGFDTIYKDRSFTGDEQYSTINFSVNDGELCYLYFLDNYNDTKMVFYDIKSSEKRELQLGAGYYINVYFFVDDKYVYLFRIGERIIDIYSRESLEKIYSYQCIKSGIEGYMLSMNDNYLFICEYEEASGGISYDKKTVIKTLDKSTIGSGNETWVISK